MFLFYCSLSVLVFSFSFDVFQNERNRNEIAINSVSVCESVYAFLQLNVMCVVLTSVSFLFLLCFWHLNDL